MTPIVTLAWDFARAVSPQPHVRVAAQNSAGAYENSYPSLAALTGPEPEGPFAVHLGCGDGRRFGLLGFDLDADHGDVERDLSVLLELLNSVGIPYMVVQSGPGGGRHVWVRPAEPVPAGLVGHLARALRHQMLPTLDIAPLSNPAAGALRPPGAPHRAGGRSEILVGDLAGFLATSATLDQLQLLTKVVVDALPEVSRDATLRIVAHDGTGHPYLPGPKRALPPGSQAALQQVVTPGVDASEILWSVFLGAARAHWTFADVEALVKTGAPGLEHLRTRADKHSTRRRLRKRVEAEQRLRNQWGRAVTYIENEEPGNHRSSDGDYLVRLSVLLEGLEAALARADACPGRWSQDGGATDRLVFKQLCRLHLLAVAGVVEADQRRLALTCGIGRETARRALERLAADGWIVQQKLATGPKAAHWSVIVPGADQLSTGSEFDGAQADSRPCGTAPALRAELLDRLETHIGLQVHDVFTRNGLGHDAGAIWAEIAEGTPEADLHSRTAYPQHRIDKHLRQFDEYDLWLWDDQGTAQTDSGARDLAAEHLGVRGYLAARERRYRAERELWAWWLEYVEWLKTPGTAKRKIMSQQWRRRQSPAQLALAIPGLTRTHKYGPYPRQAGRADHAAARAMIAAAESAAATVASSTTVLAA